jgi:hypothetical protein
MNEGKGQEHRVLFSDRWSRIRYSGEGRQQYESKFATNETTISPNQLASEWDGWNDEDRVAFATACVFKPKFEPEDYEILDFLMVQGHPRVATVIATALPGHPDKEKVQAFLLTQLQLNPELKINFIQALAMIATPPVIEALCEFYQRAHRKVTIERNNTSRDAILEFLYCCAALRKLKHESRYEQEISRFSGYPDEIIKNTVSLLLKDSVNP